MRPPRSRLRFQGRPADPTRRAAVAPAASAPQWEGLKPRASASSAGTREPIASHSRLLASSSGWCGRSNHTFTHLGPKSVAAVEYVSSLKISLHSNFGNGCNDSCKRRTFPNPCSHSVSPSSPRSAASRPRANLGARARRVGRFGSTVRGTALEGDAVPRAGDHQALVARAEDPRRVDASVWFCRPWRLTKPANWSGATLRARTVTPKLCIDACSSGKKRWHYISRRSPRYSNSAEWPP
jgi:hypothetical protein